MSGLKSLLAVMYRFRIRTWALGVSLLCHFYITLYLKAIVLSCLGVCSLWLNPYCKCKNIVAPLLNSASKGCSKSKPGRLPVAREIGVSNFCSCAHWWLRAWLHGRLRAMRKRGLSNWRLHAAQRERRRRKERRRRNRRMRRRRS